MIDKKGHTVNSIREVIAVPLHIENALRLYSREHPEEATGIERVLRFRRRIGEEFQRLVSVKANREQKRLRATQRAEPRSAVPSTLPPAQIARPSGGARLREADACPASSSRSRRSFQTVSIKSAIVLLDDCVAFTGELFEFVAVQNPYGAARIANDLLSLQNTCCQGHARSVRPQHGCKEIVRNGYNP
jgi:hypothetical protein